MTNFYSVLKDSSCDLHMGPKLSGTKTKRYLIINSHEAALNEPTESYDVIMKKDLNQRNQWQAVDWGTFEQVQ